MLSASGKGLSNEDALTAALAEYQSLRSEISWLIEHGTQLQNYAIGLSIGIFPVAAFVLEKSSPVFLLGPLLVLPTILSLLGILYFRQHQEIYVVAAYIREEIRPIIRELTGRDDIWGWEEFKSARQNRLSARSSALGLWRPRTVIVLRLAIFSLPAFCSLVIGISVAIGQGISRINATYTMAGSVALLLLAVTDVVTIVMLAIRYWKEGDLEKIVMDTVLPAGRSVSPDAEP
jgi:hypothetical protein